MMEEERQRRLSEVEKEEEEGATIDFVEVLQNSLWISSPEHAGWLMKRSSNWFVNKSLLLRGHAWQRKWVSLHGTELVYMDHEPIMENIRKLKIRRSQITAGTSITSDESDATQFSIYFNSDHSSEWQFRADSSETKMNWIIKLNQVHAIMVWMDEFERVKILGIGGQGTVYELVHRVSGKKLAMKEMEIKNEKQMQLAISEAIFLKKIVEKVSHPNLMRIEKVFQVGSKFYLAFPLCDGGELYDAIVSRGHFSEHEAAVIMHDLISALHALHQHDILHLDIKPENILYESKSPTAKIVLTDFGLSQVFSEEEKQKALIEQETFQKNFQKHLDLFIRDGDLENSSIRGTNGYISPEIIVDGFYSKAADVFAAGVVLYILLCGYPPFYSKSTRQTFLRTVKGHFKMEGVEWNFVSEEAKDLVRKMLLVDPFARITTSEILQHPWIVAAGPFEEPIPMVKSTKNDERTPRSTLDTRAKASETTTAESIESSAAASFSPQDQTSSLPSTELPPRLPSPPKTVDEGGKEKEVSVAPPPLLPSNSEVKSEPVEKEKEDPRRANKLHTLSKLAHHVQYLKSEKMVATMTKLFSMSPGQGSSGSQSRLAEKYLIPLHPDGLTTEERHQIEHFPVGQLTFMISDEMRRAISSVIFESFGSNRNRITIEEFGLIRSRLGFVPSTTATGSGPVNLGEVLLVKLLDRNNDGYISMEDIYNFQVLLMQKNEVYLQAIFRVYSEALWYPGKNINYVKTMQHMNLKGKNTIENSPEIPREEMHQEDAVVGGTAVIPSEKANEITQKPLKGNDSSSSSSYDVVEPPRFITAKHVAAIFEKFGYDPKYAETVFNVLCETLQRVRLAGKGSEKPDKESVAPKDKGEDNEDFDESSIKQLKRHKMDVNDFIRVSRIDDVLVQVLYRQQHQRLYSLIYKVNRRFMEEKEKQEQLPEDQRKDLNLEDLVHEVFQQSLCNA